MLAVARDPAVQEREPDEAPNMRISAILPVAAALIVAVAMSTTAGARTVSKSKAAKCSQVYASCAASPLCHSSNYAMREQCLGRCLNRQAKCLGFPIFDGAGSSKAASTKDGTGGTKGKGPITRPTVNQPTTTVGTKGGSPIVRPTVQQPTDARQTGGGAPPRGARPSPNRK
jgi:hypothetical protein